MASRTLPLVLVAALLGASGVARPQTPASSVDAVFKDLSAESPGCAVGATRGKETLVTRAYGLANLEHRVALTPGSVFYMASVSKQFMALATLLLERDGMLRLDDRAGRWIPELPDHASAITIRQLLHHTSGLRDYLTLSALAANPPDQVITERDVLAALARQARLNFTPGSEHLYSNSGYVLLSIIVHRASGRPLDEYARARIFEPLGMRSTRFQHDHTAPIAGRASGYVRGANGWRIANSMLDVVGDGGLYSTVEDMLRWTMAFERPEFAPLLSQMQTPGLLGDGRAIPNGYGMGLVQGTYRGRRTISHGGALAGYRTHFLHLPSERLSVVILCNNGGVNPTRLAQKVADLHLPAGDAAPPAPTAGNVGGQPQPPALSPIPRAMADALVGEYFSPELDATYRMLIRSDSLLLARGNLAPVRLGLSGEGALVTPGLMTLVPSRDAAGRVIGLSLTSGRVRDIAFTRR